MPDKMRQPGPFTGCGLPPTPGDTAEATESLSPPAWRGPFLWSFDNTPLRPIVSPADIAAPPTENRRG